MIFNITTERQALCGLVISSHVNVRKIEKSLPKDVFKGV